MQKNENCRPRFTAMADSSWVKPARGPPSSRPRPCASPKNTPRILPCRCSLLARVGSELDRYHILAFPSKTSRFAPLISCTRVQHSPDSSRIEMPSGLNESGAYSPDRMCHCTLARLSGPYQAFRDRSTCLLRATFSQRAPNVRPERGATGEHHPQPTKPAESRRQVVGCISSG